MMQNDFMKNLAFKSSDIEKMDVVAGIVGNVHNLIWLGEAPCINKFLSKESTEILLQTTKKDTIGLKQCFQEITICCNYSYGSLITSEGVGWSAGIGISSKKQISM